MMMRFYLPCLVTLRFWSHWVGASFYQSGLGTRGGGFLLSPGAPWHFHNDKHMTCIFPQRRTHKSAMVYPESINRGLYYKCSQLLLLLQSLCTNGRVASLLISHGKAGEPVGLCFWLLLRGCGYHPCEAVPLVIRCLQEFMQESGDVHSNPWVMKALQN